MVPISDSGYTLEFSLLIGTGCQKGDPRFDFSLGVGDAVPLTTLREPSPRRPIWDTSKSAGVTDRSLGGGGGVQLQSSSASEPRLSETLLRTSCSAERMTGSVSWLMSRLRAIGTLVAVPGVKEALLAGGARS